MLLLLTSALAGCVSVAASRESHVQHLLARGDYRSAIAEIERGPHSADWRFSLGLLYAYREIDAKGENADFTAAIRTICEAASENDQAREFLFDYERRGVQAFFAFPWAHVIGPFPTLRRPQPQEKSNQTSEPTARLVMGRADARFAPSAAVAHL